MQTITFINRKGGCGKSTAAASIGGEYARRGLSVLLVDFDPQASLTAALGVPPQKADASSLFGSEYIAPEAVIVKTRFPCLSLLPGSSALDEFNTPAEGSLYVLRDFLAGLEGFDRVLVDCPPNLYALSKIAMVAADYVLTPTFADADGIDAIRFVNDAIARIQAGPNPSLRQLGIVLGAFQKRNAVNIAYADLLRRQFPALVFQSEIPHAAAFKEARKMKTPLGFCKPRSAAAKAVVVVADEIEMRVGRMVERNAA